MQIKDRIFTCTDMQVLHIFLDEIPKLYAHHFLHTFLPSTVAKLTIPKTVRFWPTPYKEHR